MDEFRKDPTILFDYHNSSAGMDDATLLHSNLQPQQPQTSKTVAERAVIKNSGGEPIKATPPSKRKPEKPSQPRRRREEIIEDDEKGGKVATVAVVLCALVAIVAIGIFLAALLGGEGISNEPQNLVTIPNLLSKPLEEAVTATDYVVEVEVYQYNEDYEKGRIIKQEPAANTAVPKGSTVYVIVSAGPEPTTKIMEDFVNLDVEQAKNFLVNTQGVDANLILVRQEASSEVEAGRIIRTDPVKNEPIEEGQSIQLWVSTGPSIVTKTMVDFTSDFYTEESAIRWLERNGFANYSVERVESDKTAGKVISQSIAPGKTVPVNTEIILVVSSGSQSSQGKDDPVTDIPEDYVPKLVDVKLPENITEDCVLSVYQDDKLVEERKILAGTISTQFTLYGKDTMEFTLMIGTTVQWTIEVNFNE
jgi:serine/threonine-protein kinase